MTTIKKVLDDWYKSEKKDYGSFAKKYPTNGELELQDQKIEAMDKWCKEAMNLRDGRLEKKLSEIFSFQ